ncbi:SRPBCC family protein [Halobacteriales archaeon Cl-PHB]
MDSLVVRTVVYVDPETVYDFLVDFEGYAGYSDHLESVTRDGDGGVGTVYEITVGWWRLEHTVHSEVTAVEPPGRIDWRLQGHIGAHGAWLVRRLDDPESHETVPAGDRAAADGPATLVSLVVHYDPGSVDGGHFDLPRFVSLDFLVDRVEPVVREEAERVVERIVADLEGEQRSVSLHVDTASNPLE